MRTLPTAALFLSLPLISAGAVIDPAGDTYGSGLPFDIISVSGVTNGTSTTFELRFANPVPAPLDANLWGAIEIDVDRNTSTGKTSELDYPNMNFPLGVDYVIAFYYDDAPGTAAIVDVTNDKFFSVPAEYGSDFFRITVPVAGTNGDLRMYYAAGVGDGQNMNSLYSDLVGNDYEVVETVATPEPATWILGAFGLVALILARLRRSVVARENH